MNNTDLIAKKFFDGIRNGLSKEEAFNQHIFGNETVRDVCKEAFYEDVFNKTVKEVRESKMCIGELSGDEARKVIALYFKINDNEWSTLKDIKKFMGYMFEKSEDSFWNHIRTMNKVRGELEHDEVNHLYRLSKKWFEQQ